MRQLFVDPFTLGFGASDLLFYRCGIDRLHQQFVEFGLVHPLDALS